MIAGTLFTGFGGVDIGLIKAGYTIAWGIENNPKIAEIAKLNLGQHIIVSDVLTIDPSHLPSVELLHASPPCKSFAQSNPKAGETELDRRLARKIASFIAILKPAIFTLENVSMYRKSESWAIIKAALIENGYCFPMVDFVNFADFGVPQTRRRMIVRARLGGMVRPLHPVVSKHKGWYKAIEDIVPGLKDSSFAKWQLSRLPASLNETFLIGGGNTQLKDARPGKGVLEVSKPVHTVLPNSLRNTRIFVVEGSNAGRNSCYKLTVRDKAEPYYTVTSNVGRVATRAFVEGKVKKLNIRCFARFQSFPDDYKFPTEKTLTCEGIGNAVPPDGYKNIIAIS